MGFALSKLVEAVESDPETKSRIARWADLPTSTVTRVVKGQAVPRFDTAEKIAKAIGQRIALVEFGRRNRAACAHLIGMPSAQGYQVTCRDCQKVYEWLPVEVEG